MAGTLGCPGRRPGGRPGRRPGGADTTAAAAGVRTTAAATTGVRRPAATGVRRPAATLATAARARHPAVRAAGDRPHVDGRRHAPRRALPRGGRLRLRGRHVGADPAHRPDPHPARRHECRLCRGGVADDPRPSGLRRDDVDSDRHPRGGRHRRGDVGRAPPASTTSTVRSSSSPSRSSWPERASRWRCGRAAGCRRWSPRGLGVAIGVVSAAVALVLLVDVDLRWTLTPVAAVVVLLALLCWRGALLVAAWVTGLAGASMLGLAALWIVTAVAIAPTFSSRWADGEAPAALVHGAIVVVLAAVVARAFAGHVAHLAVDLVRGIGAFDAGVCLAAVFLLRSDTVDVVAASATWVAVPLVLALAGLVHTRWSRGWEPDSGRRWASLRCPCSKDLVSGVESLVTVLESWSPGWVSDVGLRLSSDSSLPAGSAFGLWLGAAAALAVVAWWPVPSATPLARRLLLTSAALLVGGLALLVIFLDAPVVLLALALLVVAGAGATAWILLPSRLRRSIRGRRSSPWSAERSWPWCPWARRRGDAHLVGRRGRRRARGGHDVRRASPGRRPRCGGAARLRRRGRARSRRRRRLDGRRRSRHAHARRGRRRARRGPPASQRAAGSPGAGAGSRSRSSRRPPRSSRSGSRRWSAPRGSASSSPCSVSRPRRSAWCARTAGRTRRRGRRCSAWRTCCSSSRPTWTWSRRTRCRSA